MSAAMGPGKPAPSGTGQRRWVAAAAAGIGLVAVAGALWLAATAGRTEAERGAPTPAGSAAAATSPAVSTPAAASPPAAANPTGPPVVSGRGPIPDGWPTPQTSGWRHTGVSLKPYGGSAQEIVIRASGTIIDRADIQARVRIAANNVTIKRSRVMAPSCENPDGCFVVSLDAGFGGLLIEDTEVTRAPGVPNVDRAVVVADGGGSPSRPRAIIRRAYIHDTYRGVYVGDNTVIEDSYIDDIDRDPPEGAHTAAITAHGGSGITLRHNTIGLPPSEGNSSNLSLYGDDRPLENVLIEGNLLNGGGSCLWLTTDFQRAEGTFITIRNNLFGVKYHAKCGAYDPAYIVPRDAGGSGFTWSNNRWYAPGTSRHGTQVRFESSS